MESYDRYNVHSAQIFRCCIDDSFGTDGEDGVRFRETGTVGNVAYTRITLALLQVEPAENEHEFERCEEAIDNLVVDA